MTADYRNANGLPPNSAKRRPAWGKPSPNPFFFDFCCEAPSVTVEISGVRAVIRPTLHTPLVSSQRRLGSIRRALSNTLAVLTKTLTLRRMDPALRRDDNLYSAMLHPQSTPLKIQELIPSPSINNKKKGVWGKPFPQMGVGDSPLAKQAKRSKK